MDTKTDTTQCCSTRNLLWYLVFSGFAVNYLIRINLNIALVSMVLPRPKNNVSFTSECFSRKFNWNEKEQGSILGSFYWLHWVTQIPGGILAGRRQAQRRVIHKISIKINSVGIPLTNKTKNLGVYIDTSLTFSDHISHILRRGYSSLKSFYSSRKIISKKNKIILTEALVLSHANYANAGFCWPAMHNLTANWIPPNERSKFVTAYLGVAITYPICGLVIERWGWEVVFYSSGFIGTAWFTAWWLLIYDNPSEHPRITHHEKEYILSSLGESVTKDKAPVPWGAILTDRTVWMNIVAQVGGLWGFFTLMTNGPSYFKFIHGWNIRETGFLSGLPHLLRMIWAYVFSHLGDYLLRSGRMSRSNVRKLATAVSIVFLTLAIAVHGAVSTGPLASIVDISPNYASKWLI
nr:unnamed protein product [Callosobruchus analis]